MFITWDHYTEYSDIYKDYLQKIHNISIQKCIMTIEECLNFARLIVKTPSRDRFPTRMFPFCPPFKNIQKSKYCLLREKFNKQCNFLKSKECLNYLVDHQLKKNKNKNKKVRFFLKKYFLQNMTDCLINSLNKNFFKYLIK